MYLSKEQRIAAGTGNIGIIIDEAGADRFGEPEVMDNKLERPEIATILAKYFSDKDFDYSRIDSGSSNSTYWVDLNGQSYVLSIFESNDSGHVAELTSILKQLEECGIKSSRVVPTLDGIAFDFQRQADFIKRIYCRRGTDSCDSNGLGCIGYWQRISQAPWIG